MYLRVCVCVCMCRCVLESVRLRPPGAVLRKAVKTHTVKVCVCVCLCVCACVSVRVMGGYQWNLAVDLVQFADAFTHTHTHTQGYTIPEGHLLFLSPFWRHRDPLLFPEPNRYKPVSELMYETLSVISIFFVCTCMHCL